MKMEENKCLKAETVVKLELLSALCRICFENTEIRPFFKSNIEEGFGVYCEMILQCFNIQITPEMNNLNNNNICESCVSRLLDSCKFKSQIENSQKVFETHLNTIDAPIEQDEVSVNDDYQFAVKSNKSDEFRDNLDEIYTEVSVENEISKKLIKPKTKRKIRLPKNETIINGAKRKLKVTKVDSVEVEFNSMYQKYHLDKECRKCDICNETFYTHRFLMEHINVHLPKFICDICGKYFGRKYLLKRHVKRHSKLVDPVTCSICKKSFKSLDYFRQHIANHNKPKANRYRCPKCDELFKTYYRRVKHLIEVHNEEPERYKCKQCPRVFLSSSGLRAHVRKDHNLERNHVCPECGHTFFDRTSMMKHLTQKHHKLRNFHCDICKKAYSRKTVLRVHMMTHSSKF